MAAGVGGASNGLIQVAANLAVFDGVATDRQGSGVRGQAGGGAAGECPGRDLAPDDRAGLRLVFALAGLLALVLAVSAPELSQERAVTRTERRIDRPPRSLVLLALGGIAGAMAGNGLSLLIVPSAVDIGIEEGAAGAVLAACSLLVVLVRIGAGWLVDHNESIGSPRWPG
ncbi:MAG: hypothetical protein ACRDWS_05695 [Acidimicrobiia bacterium]